MPSIGSVFRHITGKHKCPPTAAELMEAALAANPPAQRAPDDVGYQTLVSRLATLAFRAHKEGKPLPLTVTDEERLLVTEELGQIMAAVTHYLKAALELHAEPHLQLGMHPTDRADAIDICVSR
ncbi:hypothetical protein EPO33_05105 [Patescibacteria group bacterium]|nr:MAG: hypothetical protein EPO33_05105 [Patescibacteria group bacterium]